MKRILYCLLFSIILFNTFIFPQNKKSILILVSSYIYSGIDSSVQQFKKDLQNEGYSVILEKSSMSEPEEIRIYLQNLYQSAADTLIGAVLIGDIPHAYQAIPVTDTISVRLPMDNICISYQFYSDLDGNFEKVNPKFPDYYSSHTGEVYPEIWVSVLPLYNNDIEESVNRINSYFKKNHDYRTGRSDLQNGFLYIDEFMNPLSEREYFSVIETFKTGEYSWNPLTTWGNVNFVVNNQVGKTLPGQAYAEELPKNDYTFAVLAAHGTETSNGELTTSIVKRIPIKTAFIWLEGCSTGNIDSADNILIEMVYKYNNGVLVTKGGTMSVGGLGNNIYGFYGHNIAEKLLEKKSLGESLLYHFQSPLVYPWSEDFEFHNAPNIFIGDLSLTLFPQKISSVHDNTFLTDDFKLYQNYPNPFNPETKIGYQLPVSGKVLLKIFDILGSEVTTLVNEIKQPGYYETEFNSNSHNISSGVYFCQLQVNEFISIKKIVLLK